MRWYRVVVALTFFRKDNLKEKQEAPCACKLCNVEEKLCSSRQLAVGRAVGRGLRLETDAEIFMFINYKLPFGI